MGRHPTRPQRPSFGTGSRRRLEPELVAARPPRHARFRDGEVRWARDPPPAVRGSLIRPTRRLLRTERRLGAAWPAAGGVLRRAIPRRDRRHGGGRRDRRGRPLAARVVGRPGRTMEEVAGPRPAPGSMIAVGSGPRRRGGASRDEQADLANENSPRQSRASGPLRDRSGGGGSQGLRDRAKKIAGRRRRPHRRDGLRSCPVRAAREEKIEFPAAGGTGGLLEDRGALRGRRPRRIRRLARTADPMDRSPRR